MFGHDLGRSLSRIPRGVCRRAVRSRSCVPQLEISSSSCLGVVIGVDLRYSSNPFIAASMLMPRLLLANARPGRAGLLFTCSSRRRSSRHQQWGTSNLVAVRCRCRLLKHVDGRGMPTPSSSGGCASSVWLYLHTVQSRPPLRPLFRRR